MIMNENIKISLLFGRGLFNDIRMNVDIYFHTNSSFYSSKLQSLYRNRNIILTSAGIKFPMQSDFFFFGDPESC